MPEKVKRLLVVEDDEVSRRLMKYIAERSGFEADLVTCGQAALDAIEHARYDLILMDVRMPDIDGMKTTELITEQLGDERPPILAVTAQTFYRQRERILKAGIDGYVPKPVQKEILLAEIERLLCTKSG